MNSLSYKVGIILLTILLFVSIGYLEIFGGKWTYLCEKLPAYCNPDQQSIVYASRNIVGVKVESNYKEKSTIEVGARLGRQWYPKSESIPIIILVVVAVWGAAIIFVLWLILYQIVIEPLVQKKKIKTE